jgi:F-type H+-transporting ATPase subunit delta
MEAIVTSGILTSLAGRYAKALFDLSLDQGQGDDVGKGLKALEKQIRSPHLAQVLTNPTIQRDQQAAVLREVCARMGLPESLQSFVVQLAKARRLSILRQVEEIYHNLTLAAKGEQPVEIISAQALTPSQQRTLKKTLSQSLPGNLAITFVKDSKVLGGIMMRIGTRVIDATLATQLNQLAAVMKGATG